jgi:tryptophan synthase beta chain
VILFNLSGHGFMDMTSYDAYVDGKLENYAYPQEMIAKSLKNLPQV